MRVQKQAFVSTPNKQTKQDSVTDWVVALGIKKEREIF